MITELNYYQQEAIKTRKDMEVSEMNKYCSLKLCEEAGEIASLIAKHYYHGKPLQAQDIKEELSDIMWYVANMADVNGFTLSEIATTNIDKLRKRHGEKYNRQYYVEPT